MNENNTMAAHTLKHYFRTMFEAQGLKWDSDNDAEIDGVVEGIILTAYRMALTDARNERKGLAHQYSN